MIRTVYMEITTDKYQLPIAIADSVAELAKMRGIKPATISSNIYHFNCGKVNKSKYIKVEIKDDND